MKGADPLFAGIGFEVAEHHFLDEEPRPLRRRRSGAVDVHGVLIGGSLRHFAHQLS